MKITITAGGSRGDVQPYVALGASLQAAGHEVCVASHHPFEELVRQQGLDFHPVGGDPQEVIAALVTEGGSVLSTMRRFGAEVGPVLEEQQRDYYAAAEGSDLLIYTILGFGGYKVAEKLRIPRVGTALSPMHTSVTGLYPSSMAPPPAAVVGAGGVRSLYNRLSYYLVELITWTAMGRPANRSSRRALGIEGAPWYGPFTDVRRRRDFILHGWSGHVLPRPPDWPPNFALGGYWFLDAGPEWSPPEKLTRFLRNGPAPVSIGFGSMSSPAAEQATRACVEALGRIGARGVLLAGWQGIPECDLPSHVLQVDEAPHDWLLPRCSAAIHHGGAGTTGAALRAGIPNVVVPFFGDQHFWGARVAQLGAGPPRVRGRDVTPSHLAEVLRRATTDHLIADRAGQLGVRLRAEDGPGAGARIIEAWARDLGCR